MIIKLEHRNPYGQIFQDSIYINTDNIAYLSILRTVIRVVFVFNKRYLDIPRTKYNISILLDSIERINKLDK